ncbi:MAG: hypothetical protein KJ904_03335 [Alphaproteobacteria bacterium]|nr:hypothetical protein [Alphaproteobacteria bacterium]MBU0797876.1 hypothetical protein [Alphaproteobacteria bacterium]MBU0886172.1 hypothetical protein [Alphaproteobacteria bacterium]MBU1812812.1 hypothetical protein [Alphaproteobacteria bacterium]MBU2091183.1 hypothetical protein [Alphaproteobacteria bacterium]
MMAWKKMGLGILAAALAGQAVPALAAPKVTRIDFEVTRGDSPLGWQRLRIVEDGNRATVEVMIDFELKFGPIALYRYTHRNRTVLQDGRIVSVDTRTNDDGVYYEVTARPQGDHIALTGVNGTVRAPLDIHPSDYWRYSTIQQPRLLDTQKGIVREITMTPVGGKQGCYDMTGDLEMQLCYDDKRWIGGTFDGKGKPVVYTRRDQPTDAPWNFDLNAVPAGKPAEPMPVQATR